MAAANYQKIVGLLEQALAADTQPLIKSMLSTTVNQLQTYINELNNFYLDIGRQINPIVETYEDMQADNPTISYAVLKQMNYNKEKIELLLKKGVLLIQEIRKVFTGESVLYRIGITRGRSSTLYEYDLTLEEFLQYTKLDKDSRAKLTSSFKLRAGAKGRIARDMKERERQIDASLDEKGGPSTVWSAVWRFVHSSTSTTSPKYNKGNAYEVYQVLVSQRGGKNTQPPPMVTNEIVKKAFQQVAANTASASLGGDLANMQLKFLGGSAASIIGTNQIRQTLSSVINSINNFINTSNVEEFKNSITNLFVKDKGQLMVDEVEQAGIEKIHEHIMKIFNHINKTIQAG